MRLASRFAFLAVVGLVSGIVLAWLLLRSTDLGGLQLQWGRFGILLGLGIFSAVGRTRSKDPA